MNDTLRYLPSSGTQAFVSFSNINDDYAITDRPATQILPTDDASIFMVQVGANESFAPNSMSVRFNDGYGDYYAEALSEISQKDVSTKDRYFC